MNTETNYFELSKSKDFQKIIDDLLPAAIDGTGFPSANLSFLMDALNKLKRYEEAIAIGKKFISEVEQNKYAMNALCFAVYMQKILPEKKKSPITATTGKTALWIVEHLQKNTASFVWTGSFFLAVNYFQSHNDLENTKKLMGRVTAEELSTEVNAFEVNEKKVTPRSDRAKYFKVAFEISMAERDFESALHTAESLVVLDPKDVWYKRNKALALIKLDRHPEAMTLYREISEKKNDWFIWHEMANLSVNLAQGGLTQVYFSKAIGASWGQPPFYVWHLFYDISLFLNDEGFMQMSKNHLDYIFLTAVNESGNKPQSMLKALHDLGFKPTVNADPQVLKKEIRAFHTEREFFGDKFAGTITRMNEGGKSGFISSGNKSYFFSVRNFRGKNPTSGMEVTFFLEQKSNPKTGAKEYQAVGVVEVKG